MFFSVTILHAIKAQSMLFAVPDLKNLRYSLLHKGHKLENLMSLFLPFFYICNIFVMVHLKFNVFIILMQFQDILMIVKSNFIIFEN